MSGQIPIAWIAGIGPGLETGGDLAWPSPVASLLTPEPYIRAMRMIERAGMEFVVLGETMRPTLSVSVIAAIAGTQTQRLGIVASLPLEAYPPFKLARLITTLDHMTNGRIGWGIEATGKADVGQAVRDEYVEVCRKLWASWPREAMIEDVTTGIFADPSKVKPIDHAGEHFRVKGPLAIAPSRQGAPPIVALASGEDGLRFAGETAEVAIISETSIEGCRAARERILAHAADTGRGAGAVRVFAGVSVRLTDDPDYVPAHDLADRPGLPLTGNAQAVSAGVEAVFEQSGCDGLAIHGDWNFARIEAVCGPVVGLLRRRGRIAPPSEEGPTLRERIFA